MEHHNIYRKKEELPLLASMGRTASNIREISRLRSLCPCYPPTGDQRECFGYRGRADQLPLILETTRRSRRLQVLDQPLSVRPPICGRTALKLEGRFR